MKYTIEGFGQKAAMSLRATVTEHGRERVLRLDCADLVILRWFVDFWPSMRRTWIDGREYAWVDYAYVLECLPLLDVGKRWLRERLRKMTLLGVLDHRTVRSQGNWSYFAFGPNYMRLVDGRGIVQDASEPMSDSAQVRKDTAGGVEVNFRRVGRKLPHKDSSIRDSSIRDSSINISCRVSEENPTPETGAGETSTEWDEPVPLPCDAPCETLPVPDAGASRGPAVALPAQGVPEARNEDARGVLQGTLPFMEAPECENGPSDAPDSPTPTSTRVQPESPSQPPKNASEGHPTPDGTKHLRQQVIDYLNQRAGTHYRADSANARKHIDARIHEGYTLEDFRHVIDGKTADWLGDPRMSRYLRPETLFGTKFDSYLNQPNGRNGTGPTVWDGTGVRATPTNHPRIPDGWKPDPEADEIMQLMSSLRI